MSATPLGGLSTATPDDHYTYATPPPPVPTVANQLDPAPTDATRVQFS